MTPPTPVAALAAAHEPHHGNHAGYACGFSAEHCWACGEPWPCRVSRGFPRCDGCDECDLECNCNGHTGIHGTPPIEAEARDSEPGRCPERCYGVLGHPGHHQTIDYDAIRREAYSAGEDDHRRAVDRIAEQLHGAEASEGLDVERLAKARERIASAYHGGDQIGSHGNQGWQACSDSVCQQARAALASGEEGQ